MVRSYLRIVPSSCFGVICSPNCNCVVHPNGIHAITGAQQHINIIHIQQGTLLHTLTHADTTNTQHTAATAQPSVCYLCLSPPTTSPLILAAGYTDGSIRLFDLTKRINKLSLHSHTSGITCLLFNSTGSVLYSGSADTDIIGWDCIAEQGMWKMRGHTGAVTALGLIQEQTLVSSSKDGSIKVWDLSSQYCVQTLLTHQQSVWSLAVDTQEGIVVSGGTEPLLHIWRVQHHKTEQQTEGDEMLVDESTSICPADSSDPDAVLLHWGTIPRQSVKRVSSLSLSNDSRILLVTSADRRVEFFMLNDQDYRERRRKKRVKRQRRKDKESVIDTPQPHQLDTDQHNNIPRDDLESDLQPSDLFTALPPLDVESKVSSAVFTPSSGSTAWLKAARGASASPHRVVLAMNDNSLSCYLLHLSSALSAVSSSAIRTLSTDTLYHLSQRVELHGHRDPIRCLSLSSDSTTALSGSAGQCKLWSLHSQQCIHTFSSGSALCSLFVPGNKHIVIGTKEGEIEWYDIASARCLGRVVAHAGKSVTCMELHGDGKGFTSGGGDKQCHMWEFELIPDQQSNANTAATPTTPTARVLSIALARSLTLTNDVLSLRHSPGDKYLAVALLDNTITVFHFDTLAFFLSLYGHRLPVLSLDWSSDGELLVSGSADKNVKIWGTHFGDCQASLFAHTDSVTQVRFIPHTHQFISTGKDGSVRVWDADHREMIQELTGHTQEIWALEVTPSHSSSHTDTHVWSAEEDETPALLVLTAGNDRSIRVWQQTNEPLFIEEEREKRLESLFEQPSSNKPHRGVGEIEGAMSDRTDDYPDTVTVSNSPPHSASLAAGEKLLEALELAELESKRRAEAGTHASSLAVNPFLRGSSPSAHVFTVLSSIPSAEVSAALLLLPFHYAMLLLQYCQHWLLMSHSHDTTRAQQESRLESIVQCALLLCQIHEKQLISNQLLISELKQLRSAIKRRLIAMKDCYGVNLAALRYLSREAEQRKNAFSLGRQ